MLRSIDLTDLFEEPHLEPALTEPVKEPQTLNP